MTELSINGQQHRLELEPETPLLWAIRDTVGLTGTKFGCGIPAMRHLHGADRETFGAFLRHHRGRGRW